MKSYIKTDPHEIAVGLEVVFYEEGDYIVAYCSALDLSSFGKDENDAQKAFVEALDIFFEETKKRGTLEKILLDLGWSLQKSPSVQYIPPSQESYNKKLSTIIIQSKINKRIMIPI